MADNDYSITVGSTTFTLGSATTKVIDFEITLEENAPCPARVEIWNTDGALTVANGDVLKFALKGASDFAFNGFVDTVKQSGGRLKVSGYCQLARFKGEKFKEGYFATVRNRELITITSDSSGTNKIIYTDFQSGADGVKYPLWRVETVSAEETLGGTPL